MVLYTTPSARAFTDGVLSEPFPITNGTRQGCPLSPLIFTLMMESLAQKICSHKSISGIQVAGQEYKITLFANDIILTLTDLAPSLSAVTEVLNIFNTCSYCKVNDAKSNILNVGIPESSKNSLQTAYPFQWVTSSMPYLGISLTSYTNLYTANYVPFLGTCKLELQNYSAHYLSWTGRSAAFKMLTLPKLLYLYRALPIKIPPLFFKLLKRLLNTFYLAKQKA